jgi:hypothetical protein
MRPIIVIIWSSISMIGAFLVEPSFAQTPNQPSLPLPNPVAVCQNGIVVKQKLAIAVIQGDKGDATAIGGPNWNRLFTDSNFCPIPRGCDVRNPKPGDKACQQAKNCVDGQRNAVVALVAFFAQLKIEAAYPHPYYVESPPLASLGNAGEQVIHYFADPRDDAFKIICTGEPFPTPPQAFDPSKDPVLAQLRIRGVSDDLNFDRKELGFKGTSSAQASYSSDSSSTPTSTTKATAAVGYAFYGSYGTEIIPYVSTFQSITTTSGKPSSISPLDNVASGVLVQSVFDDQQSGITNVFAVKPQYLYDTANHAELASVRGIYTPWIGSPDSILNVNTFRQLTFVPGAPWTQIIFNLRNDLGSYSNRGNTPAVVAANQNFERAGAQIGFSLSTDGVPNVPALTLIILSNFIYGFTGYYRTIDQFQASLTYNFPNSFLGLTASYKNGRDEDTAVEARIWMVGLSGHY